MRQMFHLPHIHTLSMLCCITSQYSFRFGVLFDVFRRYCKSFIQVLQVFLAGLVYFRYQDDQIGFCKKPKGFFCTFAVFFVITIINIWCIFSSCSNMAHIRHYGVLCLHMCVTRWVINMYFGFQVWMLILPIIKHMEHVCQQLNNL